MTTLKHLGARLRTLASVAAFALRRQLARLLPAARGEAAPAVMPDAPPPPQMPGSALYQHTAHPSVPAAARNANQVHQARQQRGGFNQRVAVWLTRHVGSMTCAWVFSAIGIGSLVGVFTNNVFLAALFGSVSSYFLQLVLLPVLAVGSNVLGQHAEAQADETYHNTVRSEHHALQIMHHLAAQDDELLRQTSYLIQLVQMLPSAPSTPPAASVGSPPLAHTPTPVTSLVVPHPDAVTAPKPPRAAQRKK